MREAREMHETRGMVGAQERSSHLPHQQWTSSTPPRHRAPRTPERAKKKSPFRPSLLHADQLQGEHEG